MNKNKSAAKPDISIIIPHLNQPDYLHHCLVSLKAQLSPTLDMEIIVVDNGSRELPIKLCRSFDNIQLEQEETSGPGPARNKGVSVSRGEILAFIDADCIADPNWLATIISTFENDDRKIIGGDVRIAYEDPDTLTMLEAYESIYAYRQQNYIEKQGFSGTGNLAMRRSTHEAVGPFAGIQVAEDRDWGHRATRMGYQISYIPEMSVFHPARRDLAELFAKWDRHVAHDYEEYTKGAMGWLRWLALIVAICGSPVFELWRIARSDRVTTMRDRLLAARAMVAVRFYRGWRMTGLLFKGREGARSGKWNR